MLEFGKTNNVTAQRSFKRILDNKPPAQTAKKSILKSYNDFLEYGCMDHRKGHSGHLAVTEEVVARARETFVRSPKKSTRRSSKLHIPRCTVLKVLHKRMRFTPYKCNRF